MTAIRRILIANRGEIAVRIIHACHDTGRTAIAVYADSDADALFVHLADEAYALGGAAPSETYLNISRIVEVAQQAHADAVHPGYGFLSENADFAQAVIDAGLVWIGPSPAAIRTLGDKVAARRIAAEVGAPMAPGTTEPVHDPAQVISFAREHGLPIAIKAVHGGGGRGLKVVHRLDDVEEAFRSATHEAQVAFGNGDCFLERFLTRPRHVEVQVMGDQYGHVVAVGTRDCSLQRRNQKLIEEAPAPFLEPAIGQRLTAAAVAICERVGYTNAGTVEFLVDPSGTVSFMEVNTRIQVEHPVTELTAGVDLVAAQMAVAEGARVQDALQPGVSAASMTGSAEPDDAAATSVPTAATPDATGSLPTGPDGALPSHGHAMEFRINAEDPSHGFVPFPGIISALRAPSGPGIRFDTGVEAGSSVPDQFDSMLAKLIVTAPTREACLRRARRALAELKISGVPTVRAFDLAVLNHPDFTAANGQFGVYTRWIEEQFLPSVDAATLTDSEPGLRSAQTEPVESWVEVEGRRLRLGLPASFAVMLAAGAAAGQSGSVSGSLAQILTGAVSHGGTGDRSSDPAADSDVTNGAITSPITGTFVRWLVDNDATVTADEPVAVVEAMKMETEIPAPAAGTLHHRAGPGDTVTYGETIGTIQ